MYGARCCRSSPAVSVAMCRWPRQWASPGLIELWVLLSDLTKWRFLFPVIGCCSRVGRLGVIFGGRLASTLFMLGSLLGINWSKSIKGHVCIPKLRLLHAQMFSLTLLLQASFVAENWDVGHALQSHKEARKQAQLAAALETTSATRYLIAFSAHEHDGLVHSLAPMLLFARLAQNVKTHTKF